MQLKSIQVSSDEVPAPERIYKEAPFDVHEHLFAMYFAIYGNKDLPLFRLSSKRLRQVVEGLIHKITHKGSITEFDAELLERCKRVESIVCYSKALVAFNCFSWPAHLKFIDLNGHKLESLGPLAACTTLERLRINCAFLISDLTPLASCTQMKILRLEGCSALTDISALASMPLLEELWLNKHPRHYSDDRKPTPHCSIQDLSPLGHCHQLKRLALFWNDGIVDSSPLLQCSLLSEPMIEDKSYQTHDNGGRPFTVCYVGDHHGGKFWVRGNCERSLWDWRSGPPQPNTEEARNQRRAEQEKKRREEEEMRKVELPMGFDRTLIIPPTQYTKRFIGESPLNAITRFSGGDGEEFDGNSMLFEIAPQTYIFVGSVIIEFHTEDEIVSFVSPVGNNDVPYPLAVGTKNTYFMIEDICLPNEVLEGLRKKHETGFDEEPYHLLYGSEIYRSAQYRFSPSSVRGICGRIAAE